jgi:chromosomal replication initiation ATPase DnaA
VAYQLAFDLGFRAALGRDDFLVTPSNSAAVALVDQWPQWPTHGAVLAGPAASGKSHLAGVWQNKTDAAMVLAAELKTADVPALLQNHAIVVEDVVAGAVDEAALFHLLNYAKQHDGFVLLTTAVFPISDIKLPDLHSRLQALPAATILPPDDALLRGVLVKHFSDRQIAVDEALVSYLVTRMPRSLSFARELVAEIDRAALAQGAEVTRQFAGKILSGFETLELF